MFRAPKPALLLIAIAQVAGWVIAVGAQRDDPQNPFAFIGLGLVMAAMLWHMWLEGMWNDVSSADKLIRGLSVMQVCGPCLVAGLVLGQWIGS